MPAPALRPRGAPRELPQAPCSRASTSGSADGARSALLRVAAKYADGWNAPYIGPDEWIHKGYGAGPVVRNRGARPEDDSAHRQSLGFYMGADAKGVARGEEIFRNHWRPRGDGRSGWLRGTPKDA